MTSNRLVKSMCTIASCDFFLLNTTNIFKVPEMPKKVVPVKKIQVKKPEAPEDKGIHLINIMIFFLDILILK